MMKNMAEAAHNASRSDQRQPMTGTEKPAIRGPLGMNIRQIMIRR
jgi:hypothetical protein